MQVSIKRLLRSFKDTDAREDEGREESPIRGPLPMKIILKSIFLCHTAYLRTTPHWSVRMASCNFRLLTWEQQIKITFAAWVLTNNKFQIIIMGNGGFTFLVHPLLTDVTKMEHAPAWMSPLTLLIL